ncbi:MAG TPA: hypothetical protein VFD70_30525 [Anaerolineae bacterium]|nr:hypothetical protein [Anaerolineae bacterium]
MAILNLCLDLAYSLQESPNRAVADNLDELFVGSSEFSYVGNRKGLNQLVISWMGQVREKILELTEEEKSLISQNPDLDGVVRRLQSKIRTSQSISELVEAFFGAGWQRNSGAYPDFILASENKNLLGDGAILELKDSKGAQIASFNSTIPTRFKSLYDVQHVTKSKLPLISASLFDLPVSLAPDYATRQRTCYYFIRTNSKNRNAARLSIVEGSFFETVPKTQLLREVWSQILASTGLMRYSVNHLLSH